jgi:hypothetical protein
VDCGEHEERLGQGLPILSPAEVAENLPMLELPWRARFRWRLRPRSVTSGAT